MPSITENEKKNIFCKEYVCNLCTTKYTHHFLLFCTLFSVFLDQCCIVMVVGSTSSTIPQPPLAQQLLVGLSQYVTVLQISQHLVIPASEFRLEKSGMTDDEATEDTVSNSSKTKDFTESTSSAINRQMAVSPAGLATLISEEALGDTEKALESSGDSQSLTANQQK